MLIPKIIQKLKMSDKIHSSYRANKMDNILKEIQ